MTFIVITFFLFIFWIERCNKTESFDVYENETIEEKELIKYKIRCKELEMENDILKQGALILGRK